MLSVRHTRTHQFFAMLFTSRWLGGEEEEKGKNIELISNDHQQFFIILSTWVWRFQLARFDRVARLIKMVYVILTELPAAGSLSFDCVCVCERERSHRDLDHVGIIRI